MFTKKRRSDLGTLHFKKKDRLRAGSHYWERRTAPRLGVLVEMITSIRQR